MEIIVPAAGLSTRFPNLPPKYLLNDKQGVMMLRKALAPYMSYPITVGILRDHVEKYNAERRLLNEFGSSIDIVVLPKITQGPADTVYQILNLKNFNDGEFLIKDCDSYFNHNISKGNYVCISKADENHILYNLSGKSFIVANEQGIVTDIIEKQVISNKFCVGGYKFDSSLEYKHYFEQIRSQKEIFVSQIIQLMLYNNKIFFETIVENYVDVGTILEWQQYNNELR